MSLVQRSMDKSEGVGALARIIRNERLVPRPVPRPPINDYDARLARLDAERRSRENQIRQERTRNQQIVNNSGSITDLNRPALPPLAHGGRR